MSEPESGPIPGRGRRARRRKHHGKAKYSAVNQSDFTANSRLLWLSALAIPIGVVCGLVAVVLQRRSVTSRTASSFTTSTLHHFCALHGSGENLVEAHTNQMGAWAILPPVIGGLIVGLMAKFGSDKIRGDGIPECSRRF